MGIGFRELLVILVIALVLFGAKKLKNVGSELGAAVRGFKKAVNDGDDEQTKQLNDLTGKDADFQERVIQHPGHDRRGARDRVGAGGTAVAARLRQHRDRAARTRADPSARFRRASRCRSLARLPCALAARGPGCRGPVRRTHAGKPDE